MYVCKVYRIYYSVLYICTGGQNIVQYIVHVRMYKWTEHITVYCMYVQVDRILYSVLYVCTSVQNIV